MKEKANVLVMGNSGAGKSTLINSVFKFERAAVGSGDAVTKKMEIYETEYVNFRAIDTKGLEYGILAQMHTKNLIRKWSKDSVKNNNEAKYIHIIWYCIDATSKRIFDKNLDSIKNVSKMWKNVPIIIVLTKSYSETETEDNISMVKKCLTKYKDNKSLNVVDIIPVISSQFSINNETIIPPTGVDKLIEKTNEVIPEAFKINKEAVFDFNLRIKRANANALTTAATSGAAIIGAVPIPLADSLILMPIQSGLIIGISKIYGIKKQDTDFNSIGNAIVESGAVTLGAKTVISMLKVIPGLNIAAALMNAIVAAVITAVVGEITIAIMEKIVKGELDPNNFDWMKKFAEAEFLKKVGKYIDKLGKQLKDKDAKNIGKIVASIFKEFSK
ncbi:DUF697 domain-containing protein [Clostridium sp. UBA4548]|uniref:DUF697 domain-containing protein n=1 Tax=Clostridium sp. UBA4548 TaxID=1946361 RepID=UPI0025C07634|nr:DUF697 domain-containing protein [Clostridium sp. UBA4548]